MAVNSHAQIQQALTRRIDFSARHITTHVLVAPDLSCPPGPAKRIDFLLRNWVTGMDPVPDTTHYIGPSRRIDFRPSSSIYYPLKCSMKIVSCLLLFTFVSLAGFAATQRYSKESAEYKTHRSKAPLDPKLLKPKSNGSTPALVIGSLVRTHIHLLCNMERSRQLERAYPERTGTLRYNELKYCIGYPTLNPLPE